MINYTVHITLYVCMLRHSLKAQQGLLVDFASFPQKLIDLLELCLEESSKDQPKLESLLWLSRCLPDCVM